MRNRKKLLQQQNRSTHTKGQIVQELHQGWYNIRKLSWKEFILNNLEIKFDFSNTADQQTVD